MEVTMRLNIFFVTLFLSTINPLFAQSNTYPYSFSYAIDCSLIPTGILIKAVSEVIEDKIPHYSREDILRLDRDDINSFDRPATFKWNPNSDKASDLSMTLLLAAPSLIIAPKLLHLREKGIVKDILLYGLMYAEVYYLSQGFVNMTQSLTRRTRPYMYNTSLSLEKREEFAQGNGAYQSFVSGHTAGAFACATFTGKTFQDIYGPGMLSKAVWGASLSIAAFTGFARVKAGRHYTTDIIGGAIVGGLVGYFVPHLHKKSDKSGMKISFSGNDVSIIKSF